MKIINRGQGWHGQLGHDNRDNILTPKKVEALADEVIVQVACGERHTCAVTSTGSIFTWGDCIAAAGHAGEEDIVHVEYHQLEDEVAVLVLLPRIPQDLSSEVVIICVSGTSHTACVTKAGQVFTWGIGDCGELGHGDVKIQPTPKRVEALVGVKATMVSIGMRHIAVCTEDGHMYTFGRGTHGQLGHGDRENQTSPVLVQALQGKNIIQVQCCVHHTMALTSSGYLFTWGYGENGQLGHDNSNEVLECISIPCLAEGLREDNVIQITKRGYQHFTVLVDPNPSIIRQSQRDSFFNNTKQHSDVVFMVENEPIYANVDVLSQKCDYFAAMFRSGMRESLERVVEVPNCSKAAFLCILEYLCLDDFTVSIDHVGELWKLADFYQIEGLRYCCVVLVGTLERAGLV